MITNRVHRACGLLLLAMAVSVPVQDASGLPSVRLWARKSTAAREAPGMTTATCPQEFAEAWREIDQAREVRELVRLVPAGDDLPDEAAAVAQLGAYLSRWQIPHERIARPLGVKASVVKLLLTNPEKIPGPQRATLIRAGLCWARADAHERELRAAKTIRTPVTRLVLATARLVRASRTIGLVCGQSGLGKTHALEAVRAEWPETIIVRADADSRGARGLLRAIGAMAQSGGQGVSVKSSIQAARSAGGLVVIDEAHLLGTFALEAARAIFDGSGAGLLLIGTAALALEIDAAADPLLAPLVSRVAVRCDLARELLAPTAGGRPRPWLPQAEARAIVERAAGVQLDVDAGRLVADVANFQPGHLRGAISAAKVAAIVAGIEPGDGGRALTAEEVRAALQLSGRRINN